MTGTDGVPDAVTYVTVLVCGSCETEQGFAHEGPWVPVDQEPPWPDVDVCPKCGADYPDDLAVAVSEVSEFESADPFGDEDECLYCLGEGYVKRRYGTAGSGPAKITKTRECPNCGGTGTNRIEERDDAR